MVKVLYAEDDALYADMCRNYLKNLGYDVYYASTGTEAWRLYQEVGPDIVLLDVMMPEMSGYEVAKLIRKKDEQVPILFVSSLTSSRSVVEGLQLGANDYIRKEYLIDEVGARMQSILRISGLNRKKEDSLIYISEYTKLNYVESELIVKGEVIHLTPLELRLIRFLEKHANEVVKKQDVMEACWGNDFVATSRYLDKFISRIRKLLVNDPTLKISTTWRVGYCLVKKGEANG
ncbi:MULTISPECIES: response regulator transcription factor [Porphyromonadaceae]|uniref:Uncharacterized protein n=1 Tax=Sanguibacteroides justesenii TaxID=1547597 RepID=A0A0C3RDA3_9PORP|nr:MULTISPECIES: response regulator transcription factor [Porphyromonadaceae]KIO42709.1 hypothetical protein BA92_14240 [Sanguibacteroides justesenii]KIO46466.1 hypothetical protein IE90_03660 [Sanguibacteroides justesenii]MCR9013348.1 response regulator transcription factor [Gabonibacter chumensis]PXZ42762.1 DNA-binding response regulator [Sanguibacteroides justesenii]